MSELDWAVQWEAATPDPELLAETPRPPLLISAAGRDLTPEELAQNANAVWEYNNAREAHNAAIEADLINPERWQTVRTAPVDEAEARRILAELRRVHATNPLARNFELVTSPPRVWTAVE